MKKRLKNLLVSSNLILHSRIKTLEGALRDLLRGSEVHTFMPCGVDTESNRNTCTKCGHNFRDHRHLLCNEGHPSDVLREAQIKARAALNEDGE